MIFTGYEGFGFNLFQELLVIKYGLLVAWGRGFKKGIFNYDSINVIPLIYDDFNKYHLFRVVIFYIKLENSSTS
jgi:hypothetical protein